MPRAPAHARSAPHPCQIAGRLEHALARGRARLGRSSIRSDRGSQSARSTVACARSRASPPRARRSVAGLLHIPRSRAASTRSGTSRRRASPSGRRSTARVEEVAGRRGGRRARTPTSRPGEPLCRRSRRASDARASSGSSSGGTERPARGGSRGSRPARAGRVERRASLRTADAAPRGRPWGAPRTPCHGSGDGESGRPRPGRSASGRAGRAPSARARCSWPGRRRAPTPAASAVTALRWKTWPSTARGRSPSARASSSVSRRACRTAWIVGGISTEPPTSRASEPSSSRKSGFPSAVRRMRERVAASSSTPASSVSASSAAVSSSEAARAGSDVAFSFPPPQSGAHVQQLGPRDAKQEDRRLSRPVRDMLDRSRSGGSAHCRSSSTTRAVGRPPTARAAPASESWVSAGEEPSASFGWDAELDEHLDERKVRDALAVGEGTP